MADSNKAESGVLADVSRSLGAFFSHRRVKPTWTRLSISPRWLACPNSTHRRGTPLARASASRGLDLPKGLPALRHPDSRPRRSRCTGSSLALHWIVARAALDRRSRAGPVMAPSSFVEVLSSDSTSSRPRVLEASGVELALPSGLRVSLAIDFDSAALTRLLPLLRC